MLLPKQYFDFIVSRLSSTDEKLKKSALEDICEQYRRGQRFAPMDERRLSTFVRGLLSSQPKNEKVIMWALNALVFIGKFENCGDKIIKSVYDYGNNKQILVSAASCIHALADEPHKIIDQKTHIDPRTEYLAACRVTTWENLAFPPPKIPIDIAPSDELKSALVLVGTNSAPEALFHPHHTNLKIIEELAKHDDNIVKQYCYWALYENHNFNFASLPQSLRDIGQLPANARVWAYHILGSNDNKLSSRIDMIKECSLDSYNRARIGLAKGLVRSYFDGFELVVVDWFQSEKNLEVRLKLLEHMANFSDEAISYGNLVCEYFENGNLTSTERNHILEAARKTTLYARLKKIMMASEPMLDMFGETGGLIIMKKKITQHISIGDNNSGDVRITGDETTNTLTLTLSSLQRENFHSQLDEIEIVLDDPEVIELESERISQVKGLISEVKKSPEKGKIHKLTEKLLEINDTLDKLEPLKNKAKALKPLVDAIKLLILGMAGP